MEIMAPKDSGLRNRKGGKPESGVDAAVSKAKVTRDGEVTADGKQKLGKISWPERCFLLFICFLLVLPWFYTPAFVHELSQGLDEMLVGNPSGIPPPVPPPPEVEGHALAQDIPDGL